MIKFETGRCSHHEVDAHQRNDTCNQIDNALSLINHIKGEQITEMMAICQIKSVFHLGFVVFALIYWFNLQVSKRQHSLKIFERDETRVVQLLLLKPLCISHAPMLSLQSTGNSY